MGQAHFARARSLASADEADLAHGVVRRAKGPRARQAAEAESSPATLWMAVTSSASSLVSGGSRPGRRRASMVLPAPGGRS